MKTTSRADEPTNEAEASLFSQPSLSRYPVHSCMCFPVSLKNGRVYEVMNVCDKKNL